MTRKVAVQVPPLAAVVARNPSGQVAAWPLVETVQDDGICTEVLAPAPDLDPIKAALAARRGLSRGGLAALRLVDSKIPLGV